MSQCYCSLTTIPSNPVKKVWKFQPPLLIAVKILTKCASRVGSCCDWGADGWHWSLGDSDEGGEGSTRNLRWHRRTGQSDPGDQGIKKTAQTVILKSVYLLIILNKDSRAEWLQNLQLFWQIISIAIRVLILAGMVIFAFNFHSVFPYVWRQWLLWENMTSLQHHIASFIMLCCDTYCLYQNMAATVIWILPLAIL